MRSPRRMPIGNQRDATAKICRSKRAYSFLICTRALSNSALAARAARSASRAATSAKAHCQATSGSLPSPPGYLTNISPAGSPIERRTAEALRRTSRTSAGQTRLGVVMCAFDYPDGAGRGDRALSEYGSRRCDRHSSGSRDQLQKPSARKFHGSSSHDGIFRRLRLISPALRSRISPPSPTSRFRPR